MYSCCRVGLRNMNLHQALSRVLIVNIRPRATKKKSFIGYGWSRILCATVIRLRTVVCVPFFRSFCSYLVLSSSDRRPTLPYSHTYTQHQIPTARVIFSLPSVVLTHGITRGSPSPGCLWYTYLSVIFSQPPVCLMPVRVHVVPGMIYLHHSR